ncbi:MAG: hypothetical protein GXO43_05765 [Crenarchaeota archaeon]|nr:hypothetical protein [Thermoproteota archaeon]
MRMKLVIVILAIIGIIACFYVPAKIIEFATSVYMNTASPYSIGWMGTSILYNKLQDDNFTVYVAEDQQQFIQALSKGGTILIVAPDHPIPYDLADIIFKSWVNGKANIIVFDENTTTNPLLRKYGIYIDGRALLYPGLTQAQGFPPAEILEVNGSRVLARLNWASFLVPKNITSIVSKYTFINNARIIGEALGIVDLNDNGKIDPNEDNMGTYPVGAIITGSSGRTLFVFTDSYPVLNAAFQMNYSLTPVMLQYIEKISNTTSSRTIIIPNFLYNRDYYRLKVPFHPALLLVYAAKYTSIADSYFEHILATSIYIKTGIATLILLLAVLAFIKIFGGIKREDLEPTPRRELISMIEITGPSTEAVKGHEKDIVVSIWKFIDDVYYTLFDTHLEDIIKDPAKIPDIAGRLGIDEEKFKTYLYEMYKIYMKALGKSRFPIILNWRTTLKRFVNMGEMLLEPTGYTLIGRKGYRDVAYLIK